MNEPTHLDLFSGIGGFALAAHWAGFRTIGFCEIDDYCQQVLSKPNAFGCAWGSNDKGREAAERGWPTPVGIGDICYLDGTIFKGVDLITGGFPCQPFSVAGKRRGAADDRAIWPEMFRVISEARPAWVLGENVPGIIPMELDNVLSDLEGIGYATRSFVIPACAVDARHRRDRVWIICRNTERKHVERRSSFAGISQGKNAITSGISETVPETNGTGLQERPRQCEQGIQRTNSADREGLPKWLPEPDVGRVAHGIPHRVDRLKGLGNAIVPQCAYEILIEIRKLI